jgi:hypothetical protein
LAGCGGIAKFVGIRSALIAELWGVLEGLKLAKRRGFRKVEVNVDSKTFDVSVFYFI